MFRYFISFPLTVIVVAVFVIVLIRIIRTVVRGTPGGARVCPQCRGDVPASAGFCPRCGARQR